MSSGRTDWELLKAFAMSGEEEAFRELVRRYSNLVFGTALRVVSDRTAAEEVAQNVFIALSRKAAFLPPDMSLGAWLHRSAVLEGKNWVRGEMRRKRREEWSGGTIMDNHDSVVQSLTRELDDALLDLREADRAALLLRFIQQRNLKEVGESLGVTEDTAQKRVAKALEALTRVFRKRGYAVPGVAMTLTVLEGAAHTAPVGLVATAATAALSAAGSSARLSGAAMIMAKFMTLTKTQTATVCLLLGTSPVAYHWHLNDLARAEQAQVAQRVTAQASVLRDLQLQGAARRRELLIGENELSGLQRELHRASDVPPPKLPPDEELYAWRDESDYVRLPKRVLDNLRLTAKDGEGQRGRVLDKNGNVSPVLLEALGLDANEVANVQGAFMNFSSDFHALVQARTYLTNAMPPGVGFRRPDAVELVTLRTEAFPEEGAKLKEQLKDKLVASIGPDRTEILLEKQASADLESEFLEFGRYDRWLGAVDQKNGTYSVARSRTLNGASFNASVQTVSYSDLPQELKAHFPAPRQGGR